MRLKHSSSSLAAMACATISVLLPQQAVAQSAEDEPAITQSEPSDGNIIVVTAGRREQPISDVLASVEVISEEEIRTFPGASVTEVLRQSVGIDARTSGANATVAIRGQIPGAGSAVLFLFDGLPRPGNFGNVNLNNFPVEDIQQVEIIRGPLSALYGANASGGVINVITKEPGEGAPLSARVLGGTSLSEDGDGRDTFAVAASTNFETGAVGHRVSLDYRSASPFRFDGSGVVDDLLGIDHLALSYTGVADIGASGRLRWTLEAYLQDDRGDDLTRTGELFERFEQEDRYYGSLVYDVDIGDGLLTLEASHGVSDGSVNRSFPGPDETTEFNQTLIQGRYSLPIANHTILLGAGTQIDEIDVSILSTTGEQTNLFAFIQDDWLISDNIKLVAGVRVDDFDGFGTQVVPRISVGSRGDGFTWRAGFGSAFRAPSVIEQFSSFTRGPFLITGSQDVEPEESDTVEAAVGWRGRRGSLEVAYHKAALTNLIQTAPNGEMEGRLIVLEYQNIEEADISGVEVVGTYDLGAGFEIDASYEFLDATDATTGDRLEGRAQDTIRGSLRWQNGPWSVTARARHLDDLFGIDPSNRAAPPFNSSYTVADFQMNYQLTDAFGLSLGIENVFDEQVPANFASNGAIEDPAGRYGYVSVRYTIGGS